jgi:hypothetical protein
MSELFDRLALWTARAGPARWDGTGGRRQVDESLDEIGRRAALLPRRQVFALLGKLGFAVGLGMVVVREAEAAFPCATPTTVTSACGGQACNAATPCPDLSQGCPTNCPTMRTTASGGGSAFTCPNAVATTCFKGTCSSNDRQTQTVVTCGCPTEQCFCTRTSACISSSGGNGGTCSQAC